MKSYVDKHGRPRRRWELERDVNGNVIPLLDERGVPIHDPKTMLPMFRSTHRQTKGAKSCLARIIRLPRDSFAREAPPLHRGSKK
jgi:hypothetical protein